MLTLGFLKKLGQRMWKYATSMIVGIIGGYFLVKFFQYPPSSSQDAAAWVQAVGSIGAIAGAVLILGIERRDARARSASEADRIRQHPLFTLRAVLDRANYLVTRVPRDVPSTTYVEHYFFYEASLPSFEGIQRALTNFPIEKLVDDMALRALFTMQDAVHRAHEALKYIVDERLEWADKWEERIPDIDQAHSDAELAMVHLQVILDGAGIQN